MCLFVRVCLSYPGYITKTLDHKHIHGTKRIHGREGGYIKHPSQPWLCLFMIESMFDVTPLPESIFWCNPPPYHECVYESMFYISHMYIHIHVHLHLHIHIQLHVYIHYIHYTSHNRHASPHCTPFLTYSSGKMSNGTLYDVCDVLYCWDTGLYMAYEFC